MRLRALFKTLYEAPIEDFQTVGDFSKGLSMRHKTDRRLLTTPRYVERIKGMFANTTVDFRMYFVNSREAWTGYAAQSNAEYGEQRREPFLEVGEVDAAWLQKNMPEGSAQIEQQGGFGNDSINMIFTNNSGAERRPMTGWIIAHRSAHAILRMGSGRPAKYGMSTFSTYLNSEMEKQIVYILQMYGLRVPTRKTKERGYMKDTGVPDFDSTIVRSLLAQIGTFKSARDNNLRTAAEFVYECFAQYLLFGEIKFNPPPQQLVAGYGWGKPQMTRMLGGPEEAEAEYAIEYIKNVFEQEFDQALQMARGRIYVM